MKSQPPLDVIFVNSHPIQYFAPLYAYLNRNGVKTACWYCSDENLHGHFDQQFGRKVEWDIPLLEGYEYRFFKNKSWKPSLYNGFFGLFNPGLVWAVLRAPKSIVVVHGWGYLTHLLVIIFSSLRGHQLCLRGESPMNQELLRSGVNKTIKKIFLDWFLFLCPDYFLYIGSENRKFYQHHGVNEKKLVFAPYAVDNERFRAAAALYHPVKKDLRRELGLPVDSTIYLFSAKLIDKKRPLDLVKAFGQLKDESKALVLVGDGVLRPAIEQYVSENNIKSVYLPGFVNQSEITKYYAIADIFVLCSGPGETWGLSVNEAMNFGLPLVVTDICGCASDLVNEKANGFVVPCGDIGALSDALNSAVSLKDSNKSTDIVNKFSYETILQGLKSIG